MPRTTVRSRITSTHGLRRDRFNKLSSRNWEFLQLEPKGSREKQIIRRKDTNQNYLFKSPKEGSEIEIAVEVFNSVLAKELGINHVSYFPAIFEGREGVLCERFFNAEQKIEELWEMRELLFRYSTDLQQTGNSFIKLYGRDDVVMKEHNIDTIFLILNEEFGRSVLEQFFKMIGFDILIGHTDRHWENYGVLVFADRSGELSYRFSPVYDTVSAYAIGTPEADLPRLMRSIENPDWFRPKSSKHCKIKIPERLECNHFDLLEYMLASPHLSEYKQQFAQAFHLYQPQNTAEIFSRMFGQISQARRESMLRILNQRWRIGSEILRGV